MSRPPGRSSRSNTVTRAPRRASSHAATRPAGPEPITATVGASSPAGSKRRGPPFAHSWSLIARSLSWIVVGWPSTEPRLHAASHNAGHTRLVNSGMGEVSDRRSTASSQRPRYTSSFHSGIRLCSGQPLGRALPKLAPIWQNATPHIMQRLAWARRASSSSSTYSGSKSRLRSSTGRSSWVTRSISRKAPGLPMALTPPSCSKQQSWQPRTQRP